MNDDIYYSVANILGDKTWSFPRWRPYERYAFVIRDGMADVFNWLFLHDPEGMWNVIDQRCDIFRLTTTELVISLAANFPSVVLPFLNFQERFPDRLR